MTQQIKDKTKTGWSGKGRRENQEGWIQRFVLDKTLFAGLMLRDKRSRKKKGWKRQKTCR